MVFFKDFGKSVKDLFDSSKYRLERTVQVSAATENTEWKTKTVINEKRQMSNKLTYSQRDTNFGSIEATVPTKGNLEIDYCTPSLAKGLKTNIVVQTPGVNLKAKYEKNKFKSQSTATFNSSGSLDAIYADASLKMDSVIFGGSVKLKPTNDNVVDDYSVGLQYQPSSDTTISLTTSNKCDKIAGGFMKQCEGGEVGARYSMNMDNPGNPMVEIGGRYKIDSKGTVQGVLRTEGDAMCLYKHKYSESLTGSIGACFDIKSFSANSTKIHYKLEFQA